MQDLTDRVSGAGARVVRADREHNAKPAETDISGQEKPYRHPR